MKKKEVKLTSFLDKASEDFREAVKDSIDDISEVVVVRGITSEEIKAPQDKSGTVDMYLSTRRVDRDGDIVMPKGMDMKLWKKSPVILFAHDYRSLPVGKAIQAKADDYGVQVRIKFAETDVAQDVKNLVSDGFMNTMSAGFRVKESLWRGDSGFDETLKGLRKEWPELTKTEAAGVSRIITKSELFEGSIVPVPANPYAVTQAVNKGELKLCDEVVDRLKIKQSEPEPVIEVKDVITEVPYVEVKEVVTNEQVAEAVHQGVKKSIAKIRGAV